MDYANVREKTDDNRDLRDFLIHQVFPELRKKGIIARARLACCTTCSSAEMFELLEKRPKAIGGVYWHAQDEGSFVGTKRWAPHVNIGFVAPVGKPTTDEEVAKIAVDVIRGLLPPQFIVEWDGTAIRKILVKGVPDSLDPAATK